MNAVERVNKNLLYKIKKLYDFNNRSWDIIVDKSVTAKNASFNRSTNILPKLLRMGKVPTLTCKIKAGIPTITRNKILLENNRDQLHPEYARKHIVKGKILVKKILNLETEFLFSGNNRDRR